jgi:hypothetical protein
MIRVAIQAMGETQVEVVTLKVEISEEMILAGTSSQIHGTANVTHSLLSHVKVKGGSFEGL